MSQIVYNVRLLHELKHRQKTHTLTGIIKYIYYHIMIIKI